jgi:hypothetical protein
VEGKLLGTVYSAMELTFAIGRNWPTSDGQLSELLAPNRPVRSDLERQQSGTDFARRSTRRRPTAVFRVDELGVSNGRESGRSPPASLGAPEPQESGAGQRSFVGAGNRPTADLQALHLPAGKQSLPWTIRTPLSCINRGPPAP